MPRLHMRTIGLFLAGTAAITAILAAQEPASKEKTLDLKIVKREYKMDELLKPSGLSETELRGRGTWIQRCHYCHDGTGTSNYNTYGPWIDSTTVKKRGDDAVRAKILKGSQTMPGFQYGLNATQVDELMAFLKTLSPSLAPTADQKSRKVPALPAGDL